MQCLICIWVLANQESYRSIADRFNVPKNSVFHCLIRTCKILCEKGNILIIWLTGQAVTETTKGFKKMKSFPNVLGAID